MSFKEAEGRLEVLQVYRLHQYVHEINKEQIKKMVELGVKNLINLTEPTDGTGALHLAVAANNQDLASFLLSQGAHPNIQDKRGRTPVMMAAEKGNDVLVALLAQNRANLKLQDSEGRSVLFYCINPTKRHLRCLEVALKHQADVNNVSKKGTHVLQLICEKAHRCLPMCLCMLEGGADPNASNQTTGITALMEAAKSGSVQLVRAILKKGGNPNILDRKRLSAVHYAAIGGFFEVLQVLSAYSADMGVTGLEENTPLHYAADTGNANCCKFLAQRGCNSKLKNNKGLLPRQIAKDAGHKLAAKELRKAERLQGKASKSSSGNVSSDPFALTLHDWSHENESDLHRAFGKDIDTVPTEMFISVLQQLKAPVDLDQLHTIVSAHDRRQEGFININDFFRGAKYISKRFLLSSFVSKKKKGAKGGKGSKKKKKKGKPSIPLPICTLPPDLIQRRPDGGPPFYMIEQYHNCTDVLRFDRDHPPDHPLMDDSGWYIDKPEKNYINVNYCAKSGDLESLDLAFNQGVPVDIKDQFYKTPLMAACSSGNYEAVQYLLSKGADVSVCDQFCWTPLHHAAFAGQVDIVKLLLKAGASIDARALNGATPLMRAIQTSRASCVDFLIKKGANVTVQNKNEQNCLDVARAFADARVIELIKNKMESLPKPKETRRGKGSQSQMPKPRAGTAKKKDIAPETATEMTSATPGKTPLPQMDSQHIILQNTKITTGKTNTVDITFVPKSVWGKPPTTSQLLANMERRRTHLSFDLDFDDFMLPFSQNIQTKPLELAKTTD
ncbi:ankyrin repeat and EF-hand domain-containing protein 1-like [Genypterus blacodes]|uniref:ankyrin repeat and EF-hand domain-containing protein 1-like n=1 Tax=Genypterus blacodes TaxID=154954 RepID=UPI003F7651CB